jgi:hypothetical protein
MTRLSNSDPIKAQVGRTGSPATLLRVAAWVCLACAISFEGHAQAMGALQPSLSFGSFQAPGTEHQRGFKFSRDRVEPFNESTIAPDSDHTVEDGPPLQSNRRALPDSFSFEQIFDSLFPEPPKGWRGYLQEKGPNRLLVRQDEAPELQVLDDTVWDLIMGKHSKQTAEPPQPPPVIPEESERAERSVTTLAKVQLDQDVQVISSNSTVERERSRILRDEGEAESVIVDDTSESIRQLMELFSQPIFSTSAPSETALDGQISVRVPDTLITPTIRQGSRARFEIRR